MKDTRTKIISAATGILLEGAESGPSVRAVAARAQVGVGTLRHHFPTQRALLDAALDSIYSDALPDERIQDSSVPAVERLLECMGNLLTPVGSPEQARELWRHVFRTFVDTDPQRGGPAYDAVTRYSRQRVESWLAVLAAEGALASGDHGLRARYLLTVADGLAIDRVLPGEGLSDSDVSVILRVAVDTVLQGPWPEPEADSARPSDAPAR